MNDTVKYFHQDKARDPTQVRTEWIVSELLKHPRSADQLERLSEDNGLGFAKSTYSRDLRGLVNRRLVCAPTARGGSYSIDPVHGVSWALARGLK